MSKRQRSEAPSGRWPGALRVLSHSEAAPSLGAHPALWVGKQEAVTATAKGLLGGGGEAPTQATSQGKAPSRPHSRSRSIRGRDDRRGMESEGERTKEGFLGEASYSKAFPQLPNPTSRSPSPLTWHLRPYRLRPLLPSLILNGLPVPANPSSFCP